MNSSSEESLLHIQPNTPVGLKQDQSCQKSPKIFGRVFQNLEKKPHIWYPFPLLAHQPLRDFIYSLWVTAVCGFGLGSCPFMFTLASIAEQTFSTHTEVGLGEPWPSGGPWNSPRRVPAGAGTKSRALVRPLTQDSSPASNLGAEPLHCLQGKAVRTTVPPCETPRVPRELLRQGHPKPTQQSFAPHFSWFASKDLATMPGHCSDGELWSPEQGSPPETLLTCFQPWLCPHSQDKRHVQG